MTPPPTPPQDDTPPTASITASPSQADEGSSVEVSALFDDNTTLANVSIAFSGPADIEGQSAGSPSTPQTMTIQRTFDTPGTYRAIASAGDTAGNTRADTAIVTIEEIVVIPTRTLTFESRYFFEHTTNDTIDITLQGAEQTFQLSITDGTGSIDLPEGDYEITVDDPDNQYTDGSQLTYVEEQGGMPGNHLVFDKQQISQPITVDVDKTYTTVTIEEGQFLEEMGRQWTGVALAPEPGTINFVLYASGNPTCPEEWTPERSDPATNTCGDTTTWPPGKPMTQDQIDNYLQFIGETESLLENPIIPWQPYSISAVLADSLTIQDYVDSISGSFGLAEVRTRNTLVTVGTGGAPFREKIQIDFTTPNKVFAASETANGNRPFQFSNESRIFGRRREANPPNCSIADDETNTDPECPFDETAPTYYEWDAKAYAVMVTYFARAQVQPDAFNVRLPEP